MKHLGIRTIYFSKSDLKSAFSILGIKPGQRCYLILKARDPETGNWWFFIDKCLPFGASISCAHFQHFSNALRFIVETIANRSLLTFITNYLDDFLFIYVTAEGCNVIVAIFLDVCGQINFPVATEKTVWASPMIIFLGMLLDGRTHTLSILIQRRDKVLELVKIYKDKRKATIKGLQQLAGHLNFINRAVVPGRAFTRRMYSKFSGNPNIKKMKPFHHVKLDAELRADCHMWEIFLNDLSAVIRPFTDLESSLVAD